MISKWNKYYGEIDSSQTSSGANKTRPNCVYRSGGWWSSSLKMFRTQEKNLTVISKWNKYSGEIDSSQTSSGANEPRPNCVYISLWLCWTNKLHQPSTTFIYSLGLMDSIKNENFFLTVLWINELRIENYNWNITYSGPEQKSPLKDIWNGNVSFLFPSLFILLGDRNAAQL